MGCLSSLMGCINKTILYVLNLVLFLFGVGVIVIASIALSKNSEYGELLTEGTFTLPIIVLIIGIFILLLGFFGCCGASKENSCMLKTYAGVLLILVIAQVTCGILLLVYKDSAEDWVKDGMKDIMKKYNNTEDEAFTNSYDKIIHELGCCGIDGPNDWKNATVENGGHMDGESVADGCCKSGDYAESGCGQGYFHTINPPPIYEEGCYDVIADEIQDIGIGIAGLIFAAAGVQFIIVLLACSLAKKSKEYETV